MSWKKEPIKPAFLLEILSDVKSPHYVKDLQTGALIALQYYTGCRIGELTRHREEIKTPYCFCGHEKIKHHKKAKQCREEGCSCKEYDFEKRVLSLGKWREGIKWGDINTNMESEGYYLVKIKNLKNKSRPLKEIPIYLREYNKPSTWSEERYKIMLALDRACLTRLMAWYRFRETFKQAGANKLIFPISKSAASLRLRNALGRTSNGKIRSSHYLRGSRLTHWEGLYSVSEECDLAGHANISMTSHYINPDIRDAIARNLEGKKDD